MANNVIDLNKYRCKKKSLLQIVKDWTTDILKTSEKVLKESQGKPIGKDEE